MNEITKTTGRRPRALLRAFGALALGLVLTAGAVAPTSAASPGDWSAWKAVPGTNCSIAAQTPFVSNGQVGANIAVYCPTATWLSVRERVRSNRTLQEDVTVASTGCWVTNTCPVLYRAGTSYHNAWCAKTATRVTHGYHSDVYAYPGTQSWRAAGISSGNATHTVYCRA